MNLDNFTYIDVILPLPLANVFTYIVPDVFELRVSLGMRVIVPFGTKKIYTGIVYKIHHIAPQNYTPKPILDILDNEEPILCRPQLRFWDWIVTYYQCNLGDVYKAAIPSGLKLESESFVSVKKSVLNENIDVTENEKKIIDFLAQKSSISIDDLQKKTDIKNVLPLVKKLIEKQVLSLNEELMRNYQPKIETFVRLSSHLEQQEALQLVFDELKKQEKQLKLLMAYIHLSEFLLKGEKKEVLKKDLLQKADVTVSVFNGLLKKNVFEEYKKEVARLNQLSIETSLPFNLNTYQEKALKNILTAFITKQVVLLHGVTGSGKTEVYIHLIQETLNLGHQVLYLVPEIALTTQITNRLKNVFGNKLGIYHSKFSDNERVEIWNDLRFNKNYQVILGVRSSVFLPFSRLGLVIVDEEHENTYKQYDPAPRYHARNAAIVLASMHGAKTLLGTATPSVETYQNALSGKYGIVELNHRHQDIALPEIVVVDTKEMQRKKKMKSSFSFLLLDKINEALNNQEQVILFQNRRGFAPYMECAACAWIPKCKNCDVSLIFHKSRNQLHCHYCGYTTEKPLICPSCNNQSLLTKGAGTEKIEEDIEELFPQAKVARMDLDSTRSKYAYEKIITGFEQHKIDILVGTQMVSKGLDFDNVSVVGVLNADTMLNFPDFRAHERAFQLLTQVSGRAGRKNKRGLVVIQTSDPQHPIVNQVIQYDYLSMFKQQLLERELFKYPPFFRLIYVLVKHKDSLTLNKACLFLSKELKDVLGARVLGPEIPTVGRINNYYIKRFMIKIEIQASSDKAKMLIRNKINLIQQMPEFKSLIVNFDVDPM